MPTRSRTPFTTLHTEGAILPADLLQRVADGDTSLGGLTPESYHLSGEKLNEAINRAWNRLQGAWANFRAAAEKSPSPDPGTTITRERWLLPLFQELGYGRLLTGKTRELGARSYPISHSWGNVPIHLVGLRVDLDRRTAGVAGASRASPHSLLQELLNTSDIHLWGFLSNGLQMRILRDNASLTRQAYVEFDIETMMTGEVYADFALLWLLCHQSRVEVGADPSVRPTDCWLEKWSRAAQEQGTRALDQLRDGVEAAIAALGRGFLAHRDNRALRDKLRAGNLRAQDYYRQLLRQVYRLIFLFVAEDRGLLLDPKSDPASRERYTRFYSTARLRRLAERQRGTRHADLFHGLRLVIELLSGEPHPLPGAARHPSPSPDVMSGEGEGPGVGVRALGLPALGGFLFSAEAVPDLAGCEIANYDLLDAIRALAFTAAGRHTRRAVDYRNLGPEELGSVYESLLELHPILNTSAATFELQRAGGNERKTTGSHYSPTGLITQLIESALDPVIGEAVKRGAGNAEQIEHALLDVKVCDMACGSGHFLIAAAYRIARRLAAVRSGEDQPSPEILRAALHDVIAHCIYGVDVNPMAVELCRVNLWLESLEPGKPLSFLDSRIKCGNSLIGISPSPVGEITDGGRGWGMGVEIPDEAFTPVAGDHKPTASALKKRNKAERAGQLSLMVTVLRTPEDLARWAAEHARHLADLPEDTAAQVLAKADEYAYYRGSPEYAQRQLEADLWTAAFFWPIKADKASTTLLAPTHGELMRLRRGEPLDPELIREVKALAERVGFFHWPLEFPDVFDAGGFDCILGNPPWEMLQLDPQEYFASSAPRIAEAPNTDERERLISQLKGEDSNLYTEYEADKHAVESSQKFVHSSSRFPLTSYGRINLMALFAELARQLINPHGYAGIIVPTGIATDSFNQYFFADLVDKRALVSLFDLENREGLFPAVDSRMKFCLLTMSGTAVIMKQSKFVFFATRVEQLDDQRRRFTLTQEDIALFNPNTRTMPVFRTRTDAELSQKIYLNNPVLVNEKTNQDAWGLKWLMMYLVNTDGGLFRTEQQLLASGFELKDGRYTKGDSAYGPMYEGRMVYIYDHRYATYDALQKEYTAHTRRTGNGVKTQYWVPLAETEERLKKRNYHRNWLFGIRRIARNTDERTVIGTVFPRMASTYGLYLIMTKVEDPKSNATLFANILSLIFDYFCRNALSQPSITYEVFKQLPVLPSTAYTLADVDFIAPRVLELVYTAWDMKPFAEDMGYHGEPFRWDEDRRALLRAELDAYYAKLYGLTRDELRYILDPKDVYGPDFPGETFRVLKEKEARLYGEYRTRRLVLEAWERMGVVG